MLNPYPGTFASVSGGAIEIFLCLSINVIYNPGIVKSMKDRSPATASPLGPVTIPRISGQIA